MSCTSLGDDPDSTKETLNKLLIESQSPDQETRDFAEQGINSLEQTEDFGVNLTEILINSENELAVRQLASKTLLLYVESHWRNLFNEEFEFPEIKLEYKEKIKQLLPLGLRESTKEIRTVVAQTICAIAYWDWSENWPGLYDVLLDCLSQESDFAVHEAMLVLYTCIRHIGVAELSNAGSVILQAMYQIFQGENKYSVLIRKQAVEIFTTIIGFLIIPDYCKTDFVLQSIQPVLPMFCEKFMIILREKNEITSNNRLKTDVVKAINMLTATIPKCISDLLPQMMPLILETLADSAKAYREHNVNDEEDIDDEDIDYNGDILNNRDALVTVILEFISILIRGPDEYILNLSEFNLSNYQWFYLQSNLPPETIEHLMIFMEFTDKQIDQWTNNHSQFLIEGEIDVNSNSIRGLVRNLLIKMVDHPKRTASNILLVIILKQIQAENAMRISSGVSSWKSHETSLLAFCIVKTIIVDKQKAKSLDFDVADFLENVVLADATNSESHPFLVGRCLYLGGIYADQIPPEMMSSFLKATTNGLKNRSACVKICAAIAANSWLRTISPEGDNDNEIILRPHLPAMFEGLFNLGSQLMSAEGLELILKSFAVLASLHKKFAACVKKKICTLTITAFIDFHNDFSILRVCEEIFREFSLNPECRETLQACLVPKLVDMMSVNPSDKPDNGKVALDMLHVLLEHSPRPLSSLLIETAFPASCNCILNSGDQATLQSGGKVVCTYFSVASQQVISYKDNDNKTGSQYILKVVGKLLEPQSSNFRIEDAYELIRLLIKTAAITFEEDTNMQQLLIAVLRKMDCIERVFARRLLMVFAHLINTQFNIVHNFLSTVSGPVGDNTLNVLVSDGFCKEHKFFDSDDRKIVNLVLSKILEHGVRQNESNVHRDTAAQVIKRNIKPDFSKKMLKILLSEMLSHDQQTREAAEHKLRVLKTEDKFVLNLMQIIIDSDGQLAVRQLACAHLKTYAETHLHSWGIRSLQPSYKLPLKIKKKLQKLLLIGLREPDSKIRKVVAYVVSIIASWDKRPGQLLDQYWPRSWPGLFDTLLNYLNEENEFAVDGALQVLNADKSSVVNAVILQEMYRIFEDQNQYSVGIRGRAVGVFTQIVYECEASFVDECLQQAIPMFCRKFIQCLSDNDLSSENCGLKIQIIEAINALKSRLPKCISNLFSKMLFLIWKTLIKIAKVYQGDIINGSKNIMNKVVTASKDEDVINNTGKLVVKILYFDHSLVDDHYSYLRDNLSAEYFYHLIIFMGITDDMIQLWSNDPNKFCAWEEQLDYADDLREEVILVIFERICRFPSEVTANALVIAVLKQMEAEITRRASSISPVNQNWWKLHEAFLLAFCLVKDVIVEKHNEGTLHFDIVALLENVILPDLDDNESHPLLIARCLRLGGLYVEQMPLEIASRFLTATVNGLQNQFVCTKICAAFAARCWFRVASVNKNGGYRKILEPNVPALFQGIFDLGSQSKSENINELVMENMYYLALFHRVFTTSVLSEIYNLTNAVYHQSDYGSKTHRVCKLFFKEFTQNPKYVGPLQTILVPILIGGSDIDLTDILVRHSPRPLSNLLIETLFPATCQYVLSAGEDDWDLTAYANVICTYLLVADQQVIGYRDEHGKTGQQYILQVAAKLLDVMTVHPVCSMDEFEVHISKFRGSEALAAYEIVTLLTKKAGNMLEADVSDMHRFLAAMLSKMKTTKDEAVLHRRNLLVWAHLINAQIDLVLNFLSTIDGSARQRRRGIAEKDALVDVIFHGFCEEYTILENDERKTVTLAFYKILEYGMTHQMSRLHHITVKGIEESGTTTPLLVEICKLIRTQLSREVEELDKDQEI